MNRTISPQLNRCAHFSAVVTMLMSGCAAQTETKSASTTPANLVPTANELRVLRMPAEGVQIYHCKVVDGKPAAWAFVSPEADLFDESGARVGKHYAGPTWDLNDGSKIVGTVKERANSTTPGAIPWLLLSAKSTGSAGKLEKVVSLQRVNTVGGAVPATGCTASEMGKRTRVNYKAEHIYYAAK